MPVRVRIRGRQDEYESINLEDEDQKHKLFEKDTLRHPPSKPWKVKSQRSSCSSYATSSRHSSDAIQDCMAEIASVKSQLSVTQKITCMMQP